MIPDTSSQIRTENNPDNSSENKPDKSSQHVTKNKPGEKLRASGWKDRVTAKAYDKEGMLWNQQRRNKAMDYIVSKTELNSSMSNWDIYEFGVYTGGGMREWVKGFKQRGLSFGNMWGFDSFQGMPDSDLAKNDPHYKDDKSWQAGGLNTADQLKIYDFEKLKEHIIRAVGYSKGETILVRGFFNESLPSLSSELKAQMKPALLIDIDCDIYAGTVEAMEFMIQSGLMVPGSLVYYDDWVHGEDEGEGKAHVEITAKYDIKWKVLRSKWVYQVVSMWHR